MWKSELWTNRDFEAFEILLAPFSSQLKESHLVATAHAIVGLPTPGPRAHPQNGSLALDGRTMTTIAAKGPIDEEEHSGALFWIVGRTSQAPQ